MEINNMGDSEVIHANGAEVGGRVTVEDVFVNLALAQPAKRFLTFGCHF